MQILRSTGSRLAIATVVILAGAACSDEPIDPGEHPDAGGVVILDADGEVLAMTVNANQPFDEPIVLTAGEDISIEVLFLDAEEPGNLDLAFHPDPEEGQSLEVTIDDESIAGYHGHGDHGHLEGFAAGETEARFELMHGSHADFRSGPLTIIVE